LPIETPAVAFRTLDGLAVEDERLERVIALPTAVFVKRHVGGLLQVYSENGCASD
jgi:hypothetical protein